MGPRVQRRAGVWPRLGRHTRTSVQGRLGGAFGFNVEHCSKNQNLKADFSSPGYKVEGAVNQPFSPCKERKGRRKCNSKPKPCYSGTREEDDTYSLRQAAHRMEEALADSRQERTVRNICKGTGVEATGTGRGNLYQGAWAPVTLGRREH